ncbi:T9SS type A sorting domain-containing protein [Labilibacter sediminis]|nr:T9SS type A sorting domain-containing protein [Labilibacter sediminis]
MKQFYRIVMVCSFLSLLMPAMAQNTAHNDWDLLDKPVRRAHWSWTNYALKSETVQDRYLDFCRNKSISDVYLWIAEYYWDAGADYSIPNQSDLAQFIAKANTLGIKVWGVYYLYDMDNGNGLDYMGNTSTDQHIEVAQKIMDAAAAFNSTYPNAGLHGLQNDNEPKSTSLLVPFLEFCNAASSRLETLNNTLEAEGARQLIHSAALRPGWIKSNGVTYNGSYNYVAYHYLTENKHAAVMNYTSNGTSFKTVGETILGWADEISGDQIVALGVETDDIIGKWPGAEYETYADEIFDENDNTRFNKLETDMDAAEAAFMNYSSYDRIAIHSNGYIEHWFDGERDFSVIGAAPSGTEFVDLFDDDSPNAYDWTFTPPSTSLILQTNWSLVSVDSEETTGEDGAATNAFDADETTIWHTQWDGASPGFPHEIVIDMGQSYDINEFSYLPRQNGTENGTIKDYELYISEDINNWGTAVATGSFARNTTEKSVTFSAVSGRYFKFVANSEINGNFFASAAELRMYQTTDTNDPNLITNSGFEDGDAPWVYQTNAARISNNANTGSYACYLPQKASQVLVVVNGLKANTTYTATTYVKKDASASGNMTLVAENFGGTTVKIRDNTTSYKQISVTFTTGANNTSAQVRVRKGLDGAGYVDDIELVEGSIKSANLPAIESDVQDELSIYPNPVSGNVFNAALTTQDNTVADYIIYNVHSQILKRGSFPTVIGFNKKSIQIDGLRKGFYILQIKQANTVYKKQFIIN